MPTGRWSRDAMSATGDATEGPSAMVCWTFPYSAKLGAGDKADADWSGLGGAELRAQPPWQWWTSVKTNESDDLLREGRVKYIA